MAIVSLLDVSLSFGGAPLLDKVNLQIDRGERVCLLGRNGAGKSTLMKVITGELNADVGQVFRQAGAVFSSLRQEVPAGLTGTVRTVVEGEGGAYEVHNDWERHDRVERLLEGMGLPVDHEFAALSAGQKRRVLLARPLRVVRRIEITQHEVVTFDRLQKFRIVERLAEGVVQDLHHLRIHAFGAADAVR